MKNQQKMYRKFKDESGIEKIELEQVIELTEGRGSELSPKG